MKRRFNILIKLLCTIPVTMGGAKLSLLIAKKISNPYNDEQGIKLTKSLSAILAVVSMIETLLFVALALLIDDIFRI